MSEVRTLVKSISGFTLVEILAVVVVLTMLSGLMLPKVFKGVEESKAKGCSANVKMLQAEVDRYYLDVGSYPSSLTELKSSTAPGWAGPYIEEVPSCPVKSTATYSITNGKVSCNHATQ